jgi:CubicO group peptidase (beta-lactamase class C family)
MRVGFSFARAPGTAFEYSNLSYAILGRVIAAAADVDYRRAVETRVLRPLRLDATGFDPSATTMADVAVGYHKRDGRWVAMPLAAHGEFAAMGGLFSTVRDLARWIGEFTDSFPPRDDAAGDHVLSRATRREMQQVQRLEAPVSQLQTSADGDLPGVDRAATHGADASPLPPGGYGFGLFVEHDPAVGVVVSHPGGLPGFGSAMRWHPDSGLGVVVLANATYAPVSEVAERALTVLLGTTTPRPRDALWPETEAARRHVTSLLERWDDELAHAIFAPNVDQDEPLERRRAAVERLREQCGGLSPDPDSALEIESPAAVAWVMRGTRGRVRVAMTLSPQRPPAIQTLEFTLVGQIDVLPAGEPA